MVNMDQKRQFALVRIAFGFVWAIDAYFKWLPAFISNFTDYVSEGFEGQSGVVQAWINLWINIVGVNPEIFTYIVAVAETAIAIGLIFGLFTRTALVGGGLLSLAIWSTAEGFGGPYVAGSTDIGAAIIYALVFVALTIGRCWEDLSIDAAMKKKYAAVA